MTFVSIFSLSAYFIFVLSRKMAVLDKHRAMLTYHIMLNYFVRGSMNQDSKTVVNFCLRSMAEGPSKYLSCYYFHLVNLLLGRRPGLVM